MRVVFTVALAVAVAAVAVPAIDAAGVQRADTKAGAAVERLVTAARTLAAGNDALPSERGPARQVIELDLPQASVASAAFGSLTVGPPRGETSGDTAGTGYGGVSGAGPDEGSRTGDSDGGSASRTASATTRITWRVDGGDRRVRQVAGLRIRPANGERFELGRGGRQRLVLRLVSRGGRRVVTVTAGARRFK